ncbi:isoleucine-tRNA ligase [Dimargaris xerosporica]|nr:isoleucine-tRNA ligase [Dimargaris xerosporica]
MPLHNLLALGLRRSALFGPPWSAFVEPLRLIRPAFQPAVLLSRSNGSTLSAKHYSKTLLLPKTDFPLRPKKTKPDPKATEAHLTRLYQWQQRHNRGPPFILHDGPPYANGDLHIGHALNRILKDIINRYQILRGRNVCYIPGWDCHGLPIEIKALEQLQAKGVSAEDHRLDPLTIRRHARKLALNTVTKQKRDLISWDVLANWTFTEPNSRYQTLDREYELRQLQVFKAMVQQGYIYRRTRPVYWSPSSRTALAEAELQYHTNHVSQSVYARFPVNVASLSGLKKHPMCLEAGVPLYAMVWTTTPWTLPANQAIAVHPDLMYAIFRAMTPITSTPTTEAYYIAAEPLVASLSARLGCGASLHVVGTVRGSELVGGTYTSPLTGQPKPLIAAPYVTADAGTGLVHTAPGHGMEDYEVGRQLGLPIVSPVNDLGQFTAEAGSELEGKNVLTEGNQAIVDMLRRNDALLQEAPYVHSYPYDWRTKQPVIQRATPQWFANLQNIQDTAIAALKSVDMYPLSSMGRLQGYIAGRKEWCISRQRAWGVPIPVLYDVATNEPLFTDESIAHIIEVLSERGTDAWWQSPAEDFVPPSCQGNGKQYRLGRDTMDVWFDSGTSWTLMAKLFPERVAQGHPVADVYLEGSDQHRGWFQSSLLTSVAIHGQSPFGRLVTHGFTLDDQGRKMSKSLGNVIDPHVVVQGGSDLNTHPAYGVDVLRLWVASTEYTKDMVISDAVVARTAELLRKLRNTARFMLGNLDSRVVTRAAILSVTSSIDRYALYGLNRFLERVTAAYDELAFNKVFQQLTQFSNTFLSAFYFDIIKDRLYAEAPDSEKRVSSQVALHHILDRYTRVLAPIACRLADEIYHHHRALGPIADDGVFSVFCTPWPQIEAAWDDPQLAQAWSLLTTVRENALVVLEQARQSKAIGRSLEAEVGIWIQGLPANWQDPNQLCTWLGMTHDDLNELFIASRVTLITQAGVWQARQGSAVAVGDPFTVKVDLATDSEQPCTKQSLSVQVGVWNTTLHKCPRCWRYDSNHADTLCPRCTAVLNQTSGSGV